MRATSSDPTHNLVVIGRLRRPDNSWGRGEVWVSGEKIVAVRDAPQPPERSDNVRRIDVGDDFVLPGAIDAHVHSLSHDGEGVRAATRSAAAGGVTSIVEMPFDGPGPINSRDRLLAKQDLVHDEAFVDVALLATLAPDGGWRQAEVLAENGAAGFKISLFLTDEIRFPRINDYELLDVMKAVGGTGRTLCAHAENNEIVQALTRIEAVNNPTDPLAHSRTRPPVSETLGVLTALEVAAYQGVSLHLCHLSLPRSIDLVAWYKTQGVDVTLETCPHYLTFAEDDFLAQRGRLKINPPVRTSSDRDALWSRLTSGMVDLVSSDHAPWPTEHKDHQHILENHSGVPGVETLVAATLGQAIQRDPSLDTLGMVVDSLTSAPAKRFGLDKHKGSIEVGKDADMMIFSPDAATRVDGSALHSNAGWSPYDGMSLGGMVTTTILRGTVIWTRTGGLTTHSHQGRILAGPLS
ncbi:MAG TPA: amidohydrolase family protein [Microbacteriaceae bacterium]